MAMLKVLQMPLNDPRMHDRTLAKGVVARSQLKGLRAALFHAELTRLVSAEQEGLDKQHCFLYNFMYRLKNFYE